MYAARIPRPFHLMVLFLALTASNVLGIGTVPEWRVIPTSHTVINIVSGIGHPGLYALEEDAAGNDRLLFVNTTSETITKVLPLSSPASRMTISYEGDKLYLSRWGIDAIQVINLATQAAESAIHLGPNVYGISAGRLGRLFISQRNHDLPSPEGDTLSIYSTTQGKFLYQMNAPAGWGQFNTDEPYYYYHCYMAPQSGGASTERLVKYYIGGDDFLTITSTTTGQSTLSAPIVGWDTRGGCYVACGDQVFDDAPYYGTEIKEMKRLPEKIHDMVWWSGLFETNLIFGSAGVYRFDAGDAFYHLPVQSNLVAASGDAKKCIIASLNKLYVANLADLGKLAGTSCNPDPPDGSSLLQSRAQISWSGAVMTKSYDVYLGEDHTNVERAGRSAGEYLGNTTETQVALNGSLKAGQSYYWRVDTVNAEGDITTGSVWAFFVTPLTVSQEAITLNVPNIFPKTQTPLALTSAGSQQTWSARTEVPWLQLSASHGVTPTTLTVTMDARKFKDLDGASYWDGGLLKNDNPETHILISTGDATMTIPVHIQVEGVRITKLLADPDRPFIYGMAKGQTEQDPSYLFFFDTRTELVEKVMPLPGLTDLALSSGLWYLYAAVNPPAIHFIDLNSQAEIDRIDASNLVSTITQLDAGCNLLCIEGRDAQQQAKLLACEPNLLEPWYPSFLNVLGQFPGSYTPGDNVIDAKNGDYLYHCIQSPSSYAGRIQKYYIGNGGFVLNAERVVQNAGPLSLNRAGSRLLCQNQLFDGDLNQKLIFNWPSLFDGVTSPISDDGAYTFYNYGVFNEAGRGIFDGGEASFYCAIVSGDGQKVYDFSIEHLVGLDVRVVPIALIKNAKAKNPLPANGQGNIAVNLPAVSWSAVPEAFSYDVYFDGNPESIAALPPPEMFVKHLVGVTSNTVTQAALTDSAGGLPLGATYYWRVDTHTPYGTVIGDVWSFTMSPLMASLQTSNTLIHAESKIKVDWTSMLLYSGPNLRFELWNRAGFVAALGSVWDSAGQGCKELYLPFVPGGDYFIRTISNLNSCYTCDTPWFSISGAVIRVQSPNGGERWQALTRQPISWKTYTPVAGTAVRFELWNRYGKVADLGTSYDPDGEGLILVYVPLVPTRDDYRIRAVSVYDPTLYDETDASFTILGSGPDKSAVTTEAWIDYP